MKTLYTTLTLLLTASITFAQETPNPTPPKMWQINSFGTHVGISSDVYQRMSMDHMRDFATNPSELTLDLDGYTEYAHAVITGVTLGGWITASKFNAASGEYRTNREVQLGANIITGRESAVEYEREEPTANGTEYHSVVYCDMESEVNLHGAYLFRTNRERKWNVFGGIGANIGATFNDAMLIIFNRYATDNNGTFIESSFDEEDVLEYGAKPSYFTRLYIPYGFSYRVSKRFEVSLTGRKGIGFQKVIDGDGYFIKRSGGALIGIRYNLARKSF